MMMAKDSYEAPAVRVLGSVFELTLGECGILSRDGTFHGSICNPIADLLDDLGIPHG